MTSKEYLLSRKRETYQRDEFDLFLKKTHFNYHVPSIHVAGSNGKGSTSTYLSYIYASEGYKVGLFTSPYNLSPVEMMKVNNVPMSEERLEKYIAEGKKDFEKYGLSEFEIETYIAFKYFMDEKCDIAIIECGMGGEYDATNIFTPLLSIITSISLEHTSSLGRTLSEIALHKAGIIKREKPILIDPDLEEEALNVITDTAKDVSAPIKTIEKYCFEKIIDDGYLFTYGTMTDLLISTKARYSIKDACFALEAIKVLNSQFPVKEESIRQGLKDMRIKGRFEIRHEKPFVIIDGGHNPEGVNALSKEIENIVKGGPLSIVFACFNDKNIELMLSTLGVLSRDITLTTFDHVRARTQSEFFLYLDEYQFVEDHKKAIQDIITNKPENSILICGSLAFAYLVSDEFERNEYEFPQAGLSEPLAS